MKALGFLVCGLLAILCIRAIEGRPQPLLIDGAMLAQVKADDWCDMHFRERKPLLRSPQNRIDYRIGRPFNDRGIS